MNIGISAHCKHEIINTTYNKNIAKKPTTNKWLIGGG